MQRCLTGSQSPCALYEDSGRSVSLPCRQPPSLGEQRRRPREAAQIAHRCSRTCDWLVQTTSHRRRRGVSTAAAANLSGVSTVQPEWRPSAASEFASWLQDLPWFRLATWAAVAVVASQLSDFFGVRLALLPS